MNLLTKRTLTSKLFPEVTYEARSFSEGRRQALVASIAEDTYKLYELIGAANSILPTVEGETMTQEQLWKRTAIVDQINQLTAAKIHPSWIRAYLISIKGLDIDGVPATVDTFINDAPPDLFAELVTLIKDEAELGTDKVTN